MADSASENNRRGLKEKERAKMLADIARKKEQITKDNEMHIGTDKFVSQHHDAETQLKFEAVGLVNLEEYREKKRQVEAATKVDSASPKDEDGALTAKQERLQKQRLRKRQKLNASSKLSFLDDQEIDSKPCGEVFSSPDCTLLTKNPDVDTSFLPDREREAREAAERELLRQEWLTTQEQIKGQMMGVEYSYWDGTGHRKTVLCRKGDTIHQFLDNVRQQWDELRSVSADNLIYIKEDIIIPHHYMFYDFIINQVRGKSGPLFEFTTRDDVRLLSDATKEIVESHPGKVCQRSWYERNKHIFPASRWEVFDPDKQYAVGGYSFNDRASTK